MRQTPAAVDAAPGSPAGGTSYRLDRLVDGGNDIGDPRIIAVVRQQITTARAAHAFDETVAAQFREELFEIGQRNLLTLSDIGQADRRTIAMAREVDHRHHRITGLGAELHGLALATRGRIGSGGPSGVF